MKETFKLIWYPFYAVLVASITGFTLYVQVDYFDDKCMAIGIGLAMVALSVPIVRWKTQNSILIFLKQLALMSMSFSSAIGLVSYLSFEAEKNEVISRPPVKFLSSDLDTVYFQRLVQKRDSIMHMEMGVAVDSIEYYENQLQIKQDQLELMKLDKLGFATNTGMMDRSKPDSARIQSMKEVEIVGVDMSSIRIRLDALDQRIGEIDSLKYGKLRIYTDNALQMESKFHPWLLIKRFFMDIGLAIANWLRAEDKPRYNLSHAERQLDMRLEKLETTLMQVGDNIKSLKATKRSLRKLKKELNAINKEVLKRQKEKQQKDSVRDDAQLAELKEKLRAVQQEIEHIGAHGNDQPQGLTTPNEDLADAKVEQQENPNVSPSFNSKTVEFDRPETKKDEEEVEPELQDETILEDPDEGLSIDYDNPTADLNQLPSRDKRAMELLTGLESWKTERNKGDAYFFVIDTVSKTCITNIMAVSDILVKYRFTFEYASSTTANIAIYKCLPNDNLPFNTDYHFDATLKVTRISNSKVALKVVARDGSESGAGDIFYFIKWDDPKLDDKIANAACW